MNKKLLLIKTLGIVLAVQITPPMINSLHAGNKDDCTSALTTAAENLHAVCLTIKTAEQNNCFGTVSHIIAHEDKWCE